VELTADKLVFTNITLQTIDIDEANFILSLTTSLEPKCATSTLVWNVRSRISVHECEKDAAEKWRFIIIMASL
jgi:hypothetical protein